MAVYWGCAQEKKEGLELVVRTGLESEGLREVAEEFTNKHDIQVKISELGRDGYLSAVPTQLLTGSANFDVAFLPSTIIAELAKGEALTPLDNKIDVKDLDLVSTYGYKQKIYALPCDISTMFLYYRKDLIESPPQTWSEYLDVAKQFTKRVNPESPTEYGCALPGQAGEELPKAFYCLLWSYGGFIIKDGKVGIGEPLSIEAAQFYRKLVDEKVLPQDITSWGFSQIFENLENGKLAMAAPFWNAAATFLLKSESLYADKIEIALIPGVKQPDGDIKRVPFQHAWTLAVNSKSQNIEKAAQFVAYATGKEGGRIYAKSVRGNPARYSILKDPKLQDIRPEFKLLVESLELAKAEPAVPYYASLHNIMNEELTQIITKSKKPEQAMKDAGDRIKKLLNQ